MLTAHPVLRPVEAGQVLRVAAVEEDHGGAVELRRSKPAVDNAKF